MLAVVLYTYPGDHGRLQANLGLYGRWVLSLEGVRVYVTVAEGEPDPTGFDPRIQPLRAGYRGGYEYLPDKTLAILRWCVDDEGVTHVMKVDSDVLLDPCAIARCVRYARGYDYVGYRLVKISPATARGTYHQGRCNSGTLNSMVSNFDWAHPSVSYLAGGCYLLSRRAVCDAVRAWDCSGLVLDQLRQQGDSRALLEDNLVGWLMKQVGVVPRAEMTLLTLGPGVLRGARSIVAHCCREFSEHRFSRTLLGFMAANRGLSSWEKSALRFWIGVRGKL